MTVRVLVRCLSCKQPVVRGQMCPCGAGPDSQVRTVLTDLTSALQAVETWEPPPRVDYLHPSVGFIYPVRCKWCHHVHDAARVEPGPRYLDCSTWRCPSCSVLIDDRPLSWGGSAIPMKWVDSAHGGGWVTK